jgi:hypothetical protein
MRDSTGGRKCAEERCRGYYPTVATQSLPARFAGPASAQVVADPAKLWAGIRYRLAQGPFLSSLGQAIIAAVAARCRGIKEMKVFLRQALGKLPLSFRLLIESGVLLVGQRVLFDLRSKPPLSAPPASATLLDALRQQVREHGYVVVPEFKSSVWCDEARREVLEIMNRPEAVTSHKEDVRIFGIEHLSRKAAEFASDPLISSVACSYARSREVLLFCMANRVEYCAGVPYGSGGEWHRDSFKRELKAMLYLTDVTESNGPFSLLRRSHRLRYIIQDVLRLAMRRTVIAPLQASATRLKDAGRYLNDRQAGRMAILAGKKGTLILFDGSAIHAGLPPGEGAGPRIALTNYYCAEADLESVRAYYRPRVTLN